MEGIDNLWRLIGNVSNLQLRAHRWYFNAPEMIAEDKWCPKRLQKSLVRAFKYFHPERGQEASDLCALIQELETSEDVVRTLCSIDPERTIPPYEDQNNRRPPVDQTLWLSPSSLNNRFGEKWLFWAHALERNQPELTQNLDFILPLTDRRSRIAAMGGDPRPSHEYAASYVLQRVLDRSKAQDIYCLRLQASLGESCATSRLVSARTLLARVIGEQHVQAFVGLAREYYAEVEDAKTGIWLPGEDKLLERSDIHPPMKNKCLELLVGSVFGKDEIFGREFCQKYWNQKVRGRSTLRSICSAMEKTRKDFGNEFNALYHDYLNERELAPAVKKQMQSVKTNLDCVINFFETSMNLDRRTVQRVGNVFSLAQLYTLIETERKGFTSVCLAAHLENAWRMSSPDEISGAYCSRLPADSVRPFDGVLRRSMERQARELARLIVQGLKEKVSTKNVQIDQTILIEENRFSFTESLAEIKKNSDARKKAQLGLSRQIARWESKTERIKNSSNGICPYTGVILTDAGEIDHIIPRSATLRTSGTIFNSEANLIYVSRKGNQRKTNRRYLLDDLAPNYLHAQFGTSDPEEIYSFIERKVAAIHASGRIGYFSSLSTEDQLVVRHALFLPDESPARQIVIRALDTMSKARVNGSQGWFVKALMKEIYRKAGDWLEQNGHRIEFKTCRTHVDDSVLVRRALGDWKVELAKLEIQPIISHSVDALCSYAVACGNNNLCEFMGADPDFADVSLINDANDRHVGHLFPSSGQVHRIQATDPMNKSNRDSRPIFKEGIYGEHFIPLLSCKGRLFIGFGLSRQDKVADSAHSIALEGKDIGRFISLINPYLETDIDLMSADCQSYRVNKKLAYALMNKAVMQPEALSEADAEVLEILNALRYTTQRVSLVQALTTTDGKKIVAGTDFAKKEDFYINLKVGNRSLYKAKGKLLTPLFNDWHRIKNMPDMADRWGAPIGDFDIAEFVLKTFNANSSKLSHTTVHRDVSLPMLASVSGGFRIRRKGQGGQDVYQVYAIDGAKYVGFKMQNGKADWASPVVNPNLMTEHVTPTDMEKRYLGDFIGMKTFRTICDQDNVRIDMCPNSDSRCVIRVTAGFDQFKRWVGEACDATHPFNLGHSLKVQKFEGVAEALIELLGQPRSNLFIEMVGQTVRFSYIVLGTKKAMKEAFNASQSCAM